METVLPTAVLHERQAMLHGTLETLRNEGFSVTHARELHGFIEPAELLIHVLNVHLKPDLCAHKPGGTDTVHAFVEVSTALHEKDCARRWQALAQWSQTHAARMLIFVHPEDEARARGLAPQWHLDPGCVRKLPRFSPGCAFIH